MPLAYVLYALIAIKKIADEVALAAIAGPGQPPPWVGDLRQPAHLFLQVILDAHFAQQTKRGFQKVDVLYGVVQNALQQLPCPKERPAAAGSMIVRNLTAIPRLFSLGANMCDGHLQQRYRLMPKLDSLFAKAIPMACGEAGSVATLRGALGTRPGWAWQPGQKIFTRRAGHVKWVHAYYPYPCCTRH